MRFGLLGAVAPGIAFAVALAGCGSPSVTPSTTPSTPQQVNLAPMMTATTTAITLSGTISAILKSSTGFSLKAGKSCRSVHVYTNSGTTFSGPTPADGLTATVVGSGSCSTSVTATSVTVGQSTSSTPTPGPAATPTPGPTATPTPVPTVKPTSTPASPSNLLWHIGDSAIPASDGQCGSATYPTPTSADFVLVKDGTLCMRNQLNPVGNGGSGVYLLNPAQTYTWTFQTVTHMGIDTGQYTQRLIWQIHQYNCGMSPNTVLGIQNMTGGTTGQQWYFLAGGKTYTMPYTEGATDNWQITAKIASDSTGTEQLYRNGVLIANTTGSNFTCGTSPFWNFGPYMWNWVNQGGATSSLTRVEILLNSMQLSSP